MLLEGGSGRLLTPGLCALVKEIPWSLPRVWTGSHGKAMNSPSLLPRWRSVLSLPVMSQSWRGRRGLYQGRGRRSGFKLNAVQYPKIMIQYFLTKLDSDSFLQYIGENCWPTCTQGPLDLQPSLLPAFGPPDGWSVREWEGACGEHSICSSPGWLNMTRTCLIQCVQLLWIVHKTSFNTCCSFWKSRLLTPLNSVLWCHPLQTSKN